MILQGAEPLIHWSEPLVELYGFVALFLAAGAIGFRFSALRGGLLGMSDTERASEADVYRDMAVRAAWIGLVGAVAGLYPLFTRLSGAAERAHTSISGLMASNTGSLLAALFAAVAILGFIVAVRNASIGWLAALVGVVLGALPGLFTGKWSRLVNPVHALAASLWIGSLFVMLIAGIVPVLNDARVRARRGSMVANMVHAFSPLALTMGGVVVVFGVITAWKHLNPLSSLFMTPYGYALLSKLVFVAAVFGLGTWNWRRQRPTLGTDAAAESVRHSSTLELSAAGVVLVITAILLSLPSPRRPKPASAPPPPPAPSAPVAP